MPLFTEAQLPSLAPDAASLNAGRALAFSPKWSVLAYNSRALWGAVQGSGKDPYRTQVDTLNLAFKCSCPSRKFPCKHGLGLLLLYIREAGSFKTADEPAWVSDWIDKRTEAGSQVEESPVIEAKKSAKNLDQHPDSRQTRTAGRLDSVRVGVAELDRWQEDLVRTGLLSLPEKTAASWQKTAARMVDAKAPGLANRVRQLGNLPYADGNTWQSEALRQLGQLHLLTRAFGRLDQLPPDLQADVRAGIGLTINQKELTDLPGTDTLTDRFRILARQTTVEDDVTAQRTYLYGQQSGRFALLVNFTHKSAPIQTLLVPGTETDAVLVFYPGRLPYRAVLKAQRTDGTAPNPEQPAGHADWVAAQQALAGVLSQSPWLDEVPQLVGPLTLATDNGRHYLRDAAGLSQRVDPAWPDDAFYRYLALSGGRPLTLFVLRSAQYVLPLGLWSDQTYHCL